MRGKSLEITPRSGRDQGSHDDAQSEQRAGADLRRQSHRAAAPGL